MLKGAGGCGRAQAAGLPVASGQAAAGDLPSVTGGAAVRSGVHLTSNTADGTVETSLTTVNTRNPEGSGTKLQIETHELKLTPDAKFVVTLPTN